jgi:hypothetical protein
MKAGDRVMVWDSPGFPVDHYLYATVLTPSDAGALVLIDHKGNLSHGQQVFVRSEKILRKGDALHLAEDKKAEAAAQTDGGKRQYLIEHSKGLQFMAEQLAE